MKTFHVTTFGCQMNVHDSERMRGMLASLGYDEAATMEGQLPHPVKVERMERLVELVQRRASERAQRFVGRTMEVMVEGSSRTDQTRLRGRTRHNKAVNFEGTAAAGDLVEVTIESATSQTLSGSERLLSRAS